MAQHYAKDQPAGYKNRIENVAIVGATGSVGEYITKYLLHNGKHTVTAITRADSKSQMQNGVKVARVNYDDQNSLVEALKGQDALVVTMKTGQIEQQSKLIDAAAEAKVPWIMPNQYCPDVLARPDMGQDSLLLHNVQGPKEHIEKLGISSRVGLICGFWYEFSLSMGPYTYGFDIPNKKVTFFDDGLTKMNTATWDQCGRAVASVFSLPVLPQDENDKGVCLDQWRNKDLHVDSFFVSQRDMLDSVLRVTGTKESDWTIETEGAKKRWEEGQEYLKGSDRGRGYLTCMYTRVFYKDGSGDFSPKLDNEKLGLPKDSLDEATERAVKLVEDGYNYFAR